MSSVEDSYEDVFSPAGTTVVNPTTHNTHLPLFTFIALCVTSIPTYYYSTVLRLFISDNIITYALTYPLCITLLAYTYNSVQNIAYSSIHTSTTGSSGKKGKNVSVITSTTAVHESIAYTLLIVNTVYIGSFAFANAYLTSAQQPQASYVASVLISAVLAFVVGRAVAK